ncbi:hypothetical protein [Mycolicibacterium houstonense]|uniref:hypothetical protein n=1 Tax=Mycolicibacterium houstonense TaxID=146021 RepID=UPI000A711CDA|nr:hypothetical protein [Mycolicibacterium houstonense]
MARETAKRQSAEYDYLAQQARADADQRHVEHLTDRIEALGDIEQDLDSSSNSALSQGFSTCGSTTSAPISQRVTTDPR